MSEIGQMGAVTIRRHAARPHRIRGRHRASWAAELAPLIDGTQRRYTAVVGSAVAGASLIAAAGTTGLPTADPDPTVAAAVADIATIAQESSQPQSPAERPSLGPAPVTEPTGPVGPVGPGTVEAASEDRIERRDSPIAPQPAQIEWRPILDDITITSLFGPRWGRNHNGIDFAAAIGTPVYAAHSGIVRHAGWESGFGNLVVIDHGEGVQTYYAHNSALVVTEGRWVEAGEHIADAGNTGFSLGPHVHFEVHVDGAPVEPLGYLETVGLTLG